MAEAQPASSSSSSSFTVTRLTTPGYDPALLKRARGHPIASGFSGKAKVPKVDEQIKEARNDLNDKNPVLESASTSSSNSVEKSTAPASTTGNSLLHSLTDKPEVFAAPSPETTGHGRPRKLKSSKSALQKTHALRMIKKIQQAVFKHQKRGRKIGWRKDKEKGSGSTLSPTGGKVKDKRFASSLNVNGTKRNSSPSPESESTGEDYLQHGLMSFWDGPALASVGEIDKWQPGQARAISLNNQLPFIGEILDELKKDDTFF
ncbi:unnamed protein product, partial [Amoebophrya sp. A120]|eukprot:GSA120T00018175001.1